MHCGGFLQSKNLDVRVPGYLSGMASLYIITEVSLKNDLSCVVDSLIASEEVNMAINFLTLGMLLPDSTCISPMSSHYQGWAHSCALASI